MSKKKNIGLLCEIILCEPIIYFVYISTLFLLFFSISCDLKIILIEEAMLTISTNFQVLKMYHLQLGICGR